MDSSGGSGISRHQITPPRTGLGFQGGTIVSLELDSPGDLLGFVSVGARADPGSSVSVTEIAPQPLESGSNGKLSSLVKPGIP